MHQLQAGDIAQRSDTGRLMNVRSVGERTAFCTWYEIHGGARQSDIFLISDLTPVFQDIPDDRERTGSPTARV